MSWVSVPPDHAHAVGAYCLDGSIPGFWYQPPPTPSAASNRSWLLFLDGGAWCYDTHSCESRARGFKGTTKEIPKSFWPYSGYMDASPTGNPTFAGFHRIHFHYCDGSSYTGDRAAPLEVGSADKPTRLWFRGKRVLQALLATALDVGLRSADEVLWTGGSAGGIGALAASKAVRALVPTARKYKVLVVSGFFLERQWHATAAPGSNAGGDAGRGGSGAAILAAVARAGAGAGGSGRGLVPRAAVSATSVATSVATSSAASGGGVAPLSGSRHAGSFLMTTLHEDKPTCRSGRGASSKCIPWVSKMRRMCELHNCTHALTRNGCGAALPPSQRWRCLFGRHAAAHAGAPTFVVNSALDSWQVVNVWRRYARCRWDGDSKCTAEQTDQDVRDSNWMLRAFVRDLMASGLLEGPGNGAFVYSCNEHVAGLMPQGYQHYQLAGATMRDAIAAWWRDADDTPSRKHTYLPCELQRHGANVSVSMAAGRAGRGLSTAKTTRRLANHMCNPSCEAYKAKRRLSQECPCSP